MGDKIFNSKISLNGNNICLFNILCVATAQKYKALLFLKGLSEKIVPKSQEKSFHFMPCSNAIFYNNNISIIN